MTVDDIFSTVKNNSLTSEADQCFIEGIVRFRDKNNNGMGRKEIVTVIMKLSECSNYKTAENHLDYLIRSNRFKLLKRGGRVVTAQRTTTKRLQITVPQQLRWHCTVDFVWKEQARLNQPPELFQKLKRFFTGNADETCIIGNEGLIKVLGDSERTKHQKNVDDNRDSIFEAEQLEDTVDLGFFLQKEKKWSTKQWRTLKSTVRLQTQKLL